MKLYLGVDSGIIDFLKVVGVVYVGLLMIYFGLGGFFHWLNSRHPERRIQKRALKNQVAMEIRQSVWSLLGISCYVAGGLFVQAKGWTLTPVTLGWGTGFLWFGVCLVVYDAWFYWGHRMMHTDLLYRFHSWHHKSVVPTPWANNSDTVVGTFVEQSFFLFAPFFLPVPAMVLVLHKLYDHVTGIIGHVGYEYFASPTTRRPWPMLCTIFHDQHHGYFRYNYANTFSWWDRLMGTIHPDYDATVKQFEAPERKEDARSKK